MENRLTAALGRLRRGVENRVSRATFPYREILKDIGFISRRDAKAGRFFFIALVMIVLTVFLFGLGGVTLAAQLVPIALLYSIGQPIFYLIIAFFFYRAWGRSRIEVGRLYDSGWIWSKEPIRNWWDMDVRYVWVEENDGSRDVMVDMRKVKLTDSDLNPYPKPYSRFVLDKHAATAAKSMTWFDPSDWAGMDSGELYERMDCWEMPVLFSKPSYNGLKMALGAMLVALGVMAIVIYLAISDALAKA